MDGSFALLRTGDVRFTVERAGGSLADAVTSGEGLLQTFRVATTEFDVVPESAFALPAPVKALIR